MKLKDLASIEASQVSFPHMYYLDCQYISPCEACWRIFSFQIYGRIPIVERLYFHLPNEQFVLFEDHDDLDFFLSKPIVKESMFTTWFKANEMFHEGKILLMLDLLQNLFTEQKKDHGNQEKKDIPLEGLIGCHQP